jgi:hypothetical protein
MNGLLFLLTLIRLPPNRPSLRVEREKWVSHSLEKSYSYNLHFYLSLYFTPVIIHLNC